MFNRKPLNTAISMALGAMAAVTTVAQADTVFFPQVVNSDTVTTVISVVNTSGYLWNTSGAEGMGSGYDRLHYRFWFKQADLNDEECVEYDDYLPTSKNDLQTIDLGATSGSGVIFEPGLGKANVKWDQPNVSYALATEARAQLGGAAVRGFLLINNSADESYSFGSLYGEAIVIEFSNGASWGYQAYSRAGNDYDYEAYGAVSGYPLTLLPFVGGAQKTATTAFMVTPVVDNVAPQGAHWADSEMDKASGYSATISWGGALFDRDENIVSAGRPQSVTCIGRIDATSLFATAVPTKLENGGWGHLYNWTNYTYVSTLNISGQTLTQTVEAEQEHVAVIFKLEYGNAFDGVNLGGTYNNAFPVHPAGCGEPYSLHCLRQEPK